MSNTANIKNLWGDLPVEETIRTPYVMLKEQANLLTEATNGLLIGEVCKYTTPNNLIACYLEIKAPSIDNYTITILELSYDATIFPVSIIGIYSYKSGIECNTEEELETMLGKILSSQEVRRIIASLLSEIRADEKKVI